MIARAELLVRLRGPLSVVGMSTTTGTPPLIYELAVGKMTNGVASDSLWTYYVQPDVSSARIPARALPLVSKAPPWAEVSEHIVAAVGTDPVVFHDRTARRVLRTHLPDWRLPRVLYAWEIAQNEWPQVNSGPPRPVGGAAATVEGIRAMVTALLVHARAIPAPENPPQQQRHTNVSSGD